MNPRDILARHASSFHLAARFLRPGDAEDITLLYAVCRHIDDLADEQHGEHAQIRALIDAFAGQRLDKIPIAGFAEMVERRQLMLAPLITLAETAHAESITPPLIADQQALITYCYGVAGTVGELMCPLIGADPKRGRDAAVALGIAMQLTNIARDVLEDARRGRRYLPGEWVNAQTPAEIAAGAPGDRDIVSAAITQTLALAESHYAQAESGFALIPARNRRAIQVAARLYRAIGVRVQAKGCRYWEGRVSLTALQRARLATATLSGLARKPGVWDV